MIKNHPNSNLLEKHEANSVSVFLKSCKEDKFNCLNPSCNFTFLGNKNEIGKFNCKKCGQAFCLKCKVKYHEKMSCKEYTEKFGNIHQLCYEQCPKCGNFVECYPKNDMPLICISCNNIFCHKCNKTFPDISKKCLCIE